MDLYETGIANCLFWVPALGLLTWVLWDRSRPVSYGLVGLATVALVVGIFSAIQATRRLLREARQRAQEDEENRGP